MPFNQFLNSFMERGREREMKGEEDGEGGEERERYKEDHPVNFSMYPFIYFQ